jgi:hypothetical protein
MLKSKANVANVVGAGTGAFGVVISESATVNQVPAGAPENQRVVPSHLCALEWGMKLFRRCVAFILQATFGL